MFVLVDRECVPTKSFPKITDFFDSSLLLCLMNYGLENPSPVGFYTGTGYQLVRALTLRV